MSKNIENMLGLLGTGRRLKDSDGDGVSDIADCEPHNPKKQGLIHDVAKKTARKTLKGRFKHRAVKYIERKERESAEVKKVKIEERQKQRLETAKLREETRGQRARETIRKGGVVRKLASGFAVPKGKVGKKRKMVSKPRQSLQEFTDQRFKNLL